MQKKLMRSNEALQENPLCDICSQSAITDRNWNSRYVFNIYYLCQYNSSTDPIALFLQKRNWEFSEFVSDDNLCFAL